MKKVEFKYPKIRSIGNKSIAFMAPDTIIEYKYSPSDSDMFPCSYFYYASGWNISNFDFLWKVFKL